MAMKPMTDANKPIASLLDAVQASLAHAGRYNAGDVARPAAIL